MNWWQTLLCGFLITIWYFLVLSVTLGIVCDALSKAIVKVCRELRTLNIKERS
jgi:hypothetical protein